MIDMQQIYGKNELPLQDLSSLVSDGGFTGVFRKIGIVGDSLSSGEFVATDELGTNSYHDMYDYSWGKYLERMAGVSVDNCSLGGMSAEWFNNSFGDLKNCWERLSTCDAVIIALGVNDAYPIVRGEKELGSVDNLDPKNLLKDRTYINYYAKIIARIKRLNPFCHFFLVTPPKTDHPDVFSAELEKVFDEERIELEKLCGFFKRTHLIDLRTYGPVYDREFCERYFMSGHLVPAGYLFTAKLIASYIDYIVRHKPEKFHQLGFSHSPIKNENHEK